MTEDEILLFINENKEWIFSGIGVLLISLLLSVILYLVNSNRRYLICINKSDSNDMRAFKVGLSWSAFIFSFIWVAFKSLYEVQAMFFGLIAIFLLHGYVIDYLFDTEVLKYIVGIIVFIVIITPFLLGIFGNLLVIRKYCHSYNLLSENHYVRVKLVIAKSELDAIAVLMNKI